MSTCNFKSMKNFPLYVYDVSYENENENENIEFLWEDWNLMIGNDIRILIDDLNDELLFHKVSLESGYYIGIQFYVDDINNPNDLDNNDCQYYFNMCRSVTIKKYNVEINKIKKWLKKIADEYGFMGINLIGVFSNGEGVYEKVNK